MTSFVWRTWGVIVALATIGLGMPGPCEWSSAKERPARSSDSKAKKGRAVRGAAPPSSFSRIVEAPERFSRRVDWNRDGQIDPLEQNVALDHFRQLDRNRDGVVDPMERALARLDIEYDGPVVPRHAEWVQAQIQRAAPRETYAQEQGLSQKSVKQHSKSKPVKRKGNRSATARPTR